MKKIKIKLAQFIAFDYKPENDTLDLTFLLTGDEAKKLMNKDVKAGILCDLNLIFSNEASTETKEIKEAIDDMPVGGWKNKKARKVYINAANKLYSDGYCVEEIKKLLEALYYASQNEYETK